MIKQNLCKYCKYSKPFQDRFTGKTRHKCTIGQCEDIGFGDMAIIIDGKCDKYKRGNKYDRYY